MADELQKKKLYESTFKEKRLTGQGMSDSLVNGEGRINNPQGGSSSLSSG